MGNASLGLARRSELFSSNFWVMHDVRASRELDAPNQFRSPTPSRQMDMLSIITREARSRTFLGAYSPENCCNRDRFWSTLLRGRIFSPLKVAKEPQFVGRRTIFLFRIKFIPEITSHLSKRHCHLKIIWRLFHLPNTSS